MLSVTGILDSIEAVLIREKKSVADLARELGKDYNQVYQWIKVRRSKPDGDGILVLLNWLNKADKERA